MIVSRRVKADLWAILWMPLTSSGVQQNGQVYFIKVQGVGNDKGNQDNMRQSTTAGHVYLVKSTIHEY